MDKYTDIPCYRLSYEYNDTEHRRYIWSYGREVITTHIPIRATKISIVPDDGGLVIERLRVVQNG